MRSDNANLYAVLRERFAAALDQPCLRVPGAEVVTYRELDERSARMAAVLADAGLGVGDRLVAQVHKSADNVALYLATLRRGATYVPLNTAYTTEEVRRLVEDAEPTVVVLDPAITPGSGPVNMTLGSAGTGSLAKAASTADPDHTVAHRDPDDIASMVYTSGTTGRAKGAMLSHQSLGSNALALHEAWRFNSGDTLLHCLPLYHIHGLMAALHTAMLSASEIILLPGFGVDEVVAELPKATVMMGVPTHYSRLVGDPRFDTDLTSGMRLFVSGSAPMTQTLHSEFTAQTGHRILERYGMTEAGMIASNPYLGERVPGTVGFALPEVEIRIRDDNGMELAAAEGGVVEIRGPNLFAGYWKRPEATAEAMRPDGFFVTGDVGHLDEEGRLTLVGRVSDMVISGGLNVYPKEIETLLDEHDDVVESAVVGLPHADFGEAVTAFLVPTAGASIDTASVAASLHDRLARFKHPKQYVVIEELPRNAMGKTRKNELRSRHCGLYEPDPSISAVSTPDHHEG